MIYINNLDETSYKKLQVCANLIEEKIENYNCKEIIVFTDEVEIIRDNLKKIFNICGICINIQILPFFDRIKYKDKISEDTIVLEIHELFNIYRIRYLNEISSITYNHYINFIEVRTKIYEPILDGVYYE